jgi:hypothetical protein
LSLVGDRKAQPVSDALRKYGADLFETLDDGAVMRTAALVVMTVEQCERARPGTAHLYVPEAVAKARAWLADHPLATPDRVLAQAQLHITWMMGNLRDRRAQPLQLPAASQAPTAERPKIVRW